MVVLGKVMGPHGVRGQIKIFPFTESIDGLLDYPVWWLDQNRRGWQVVHPVSSFVQRDHLVVLLAEYNDRTSAAELKGIEVAIPRSKLPQLSTDGEDGYYWTDLIGLDVFNMQGEALGTVTGLLETGANDVLQVRMSAEEREILIPFVAEQYIIQTDLELRQIIVDWQWDY